MTKTSNAAVAAVNTELKPDAVAVTAETIHASVIAGVSALGAAFYEPEQRVIADNGKAYPLDASLPDGVCDTGSIDIVNRFSFLQRQLTSVVCWKLEQMLAQADDRIVDQRKRIGSMVRQIDTGRVTEAQVERLADFLEVLVEQRAMVQIAYDAAVEAYADVTEEEFETKAMRDQRQRTLTDKPKTGLADRLARLGVKG